MQKIEERHDYEDIVDVFRKLDTQARLGMSPREAADILMEPVEKQIAFKGVDHFLDRQLVVLDALAQQRLEYEGINLKAARQLLAPILVERGLFGEAHSAVKGS